MPLAVGLSSMGDARDCDPTLRVIDHIKHSIFADANAPLIFTSHELLAAGRSGVLCQGVDGGFDSLAQVRRKILKIAMPGRTKKDGVGHQRAEIACFRR